MEFSICWLTPPQDQDQKYLENSHYLAQRMVVEGGGYIREKIKESKNAQNGFLCI